MTRKIILGSCLLLVLCILWIAWPRTSVWNEIMNGETEAVRARIEAGFDVNSICPGVDTLTLGEKWKYLSEFEWPPKKYKPDSWSKWNAMNIAVQEKHPDIIQLLADNGAAWPSVKRIIDLGEKNLAKRCIQQGGRLELNDIVHIQRAGLVSWLIEQELELGIDNTMLLHWAALNGEAEAVESLIKRGADSKNALETNGNTPLHAVVRGVHTYERKDRKLENRASIIQQLIASGADVNAKNKYGETPVDWAFGVEDLYQPLRENGGKPGNNYNIILSRSIFQPYKDQLDQYEKFENEMAVLIREIAADGHDINAVATSSNGARNHFGEQDYWKSTVDEDGDNDVDEDGDGASDDAEEEFGTDPLDPDDTPTSKEMAEYYEYEVNLRTTPLLIALREMRSAKIISLLIELGADVNVSEKITGTTPLHLANGNHYHDSTTEVVEVLIAKGANVNALNKEGETPLDIRIEHQGMSDYMPSEYITTDTSEETEGDPLVTLLRKHGAKTSEEINIIHIASKEGNIEAVKQHLTTDADINALDHEGNTPLHYAVYNDQTEMIRLLIDKGAEVNRKRKGANHEDGVTPLHTATWRSTIETMELLIDNGADVNMKRTDGAIALHYAVWFGLKEKTEFLLSKGSDVKARDGDNNGATPLHEAVMRSPNNGIIELLITNKLDVNNMDDSGKTPLDWAIKYDQPETADLLRKHGAKTGDELIEEDQ